MEGCIFQLTQTRQLYVLSTGEEISLPAFPPWLTPPIDPAIETTNPCPNAEAADQPTPDQPALGLIFSILSQNGATGRLVGGAVRDYLRGVPVHDFDIAVDCLPDETMAYFSAAGYKVIPTGIDHGTVTVVIDQTPYELTSLRADVETDGRRAVVAFTKEWRLDAVRRDFTFNALYMDADGRVFDYFEGYQDLMQRQIRFVGNARERIQEDYLRILRYFRFAGRICTQPISTELRDIFQEYAPKLATLSRERVWKEWQQILTSPGCYQAVKEMQMCQVMNWLYHTENEAEEATKSDFSISEKGYNALFYLEEPHASHRDDLQQYEIMIDIGIDKQDAILRLALLHHEMTAEQAQALSLNLKMSKKDSKRLQQFIAALALYHEIGMNFFGADEVLRSIDPEKATAFYQFYYDVVQKDGPGQMAQIALFLNSAIEESSFASFTSMKIYSFIENNRNVDCPVSGRDALAVGLVPGQKMGHLLRHAKNYWIGSGFRCSKEYLVKCLGYFV